ncbi:MAG: DNA cytosine methyltransferase [Bryobacteraceae bacterium]
MITAIDLFCGVGGLTHGLTRGGVRVVAGIDIDPGCRYAYEANNTARFFERDVSALNAADLGSLWGTERYTLLAGCAPCQPFSTYSRPARSSRRDGKWSLLAGFGKLIEAANPAFVTMENVPQLELHPVFSEFLKTLSGYKVWCDIVDCSRYGVPQTRKRLVLLASRLGPVRLLPYRAKCPSVRNAISHLPPLRAGDHDATDPLHSACSLSDLNLRRIKASKPGGTWRDWPRSLRADCHREKSGETYPSVYGRMEWDSPAPTVTTQCFGYGNGRFGHPEQDRAISLREAAVLQTFPDSYRFLRAGERPRFYVLGRLIGNAVPPRLGEAIGRSLVAHVKALEERT